MDVTKETQTNEFCLLSQLFFLKKKKSNFQLLLFKKKNYSGRLQETSF